MTDGQDNQTNLADAPGQAEEMSSDAGGSQDNVSAEGHSAPEAPVIEKVEAPVSETTSAAVPTAATGTEASLPTISLDEFRPKAIATAGAALAGAFIFNEKAERRFRDTAANYRARLSQFGSQEV